MEQEFKMDDDLRKKVWNVEIELLNKVLDICKKYNLKIFADSGTLIGAVRHNGFIPWDDDIDMTMPRKDFNKLCELAETEFDDLYFFQTESTDPGSTRGHIQIRKSNTTAILDCEKEWKFQFNQGIFIDIFPLDNIPNNKLLRKIFLIRADIKKKNSMRFRGLTVGYIPKSGLKGWIKKILHFFFDKINKKKGNIFCKDFEKYIQKYQNMKNVKCIANISISPLKKTGFFNKDFFSNSILLKYEDTEIPVPIEYEKVLDSMYGNWRTPIKSPTVHGNVFFDVENSYKKYI